MSPTPKKVPVDDNGTPDSMHLERLMFASPEREAKRYVGIMADPTTAKLFVNLGASQARRRWKGFGHGVRRVETTGNQRAVIVHTATGRHLRQIEAKFADVGFAETGIGLSEPADLTEVTEALDGIESVQCHAHQ